LTALVAAVVLLPAVLRRLCHGTSAHGGFAAVIFAAAFGARPPLVEEGNMGHQPGSSGHLHGLFPV